MKHWNSIHEIKAANALMGHTFFGTREMRIFGSRVYPRVYGGRFFVTSEQPPHGPRIYCVRWVTDEGAIMTAGDFPHCSSLVMARDLIRAFLDGCATPPWTFGNGLQVWEALLKLRAAEGVPA